MITKSVKVSLKIRTQGRNSSIRGSNSDQGTEDMGDKEDMEEAMEEAMEDNGTRMGEANTNTGKKSD